MPSSRPDRRRPLGRRRLRRRRAAAARRGPYRAVPAHEQLGGRRLLRQRARLSGRAPRLPRARPAAAPRELRAASIASRCSPTSSPSTARAARRIPTCSATGRSSSASCAATRSGSARRRSRRGTTRASTRPSAACRGCARPSTRAKDQSYFLHAVAAADLVDVLMPLGELHEARGARDRAQRRARPSPRRRTAPASASSASGRSRSSCASTCPTSPASFATTRGNERGRHRGLAYYTLGQRHGLHIGGAADRPEDAVVRRREGRARATSSSSSKATSTRCSRPTALVASGRALDRPAAARVGAAPAAALPGQDSLSATRSGLHGRPHGRRRSLEAQFDEPQRTPTPGQFIVLYDGDRCLGGATIDGRAHGVRRRCAPRSSSPLRARFPAYNPAVPIESS